MYSRRELVCFSDIGRSRSVEHLPHPFPSALNLFSQSRRWFVHVSFHINWFRPPLQSSTISVQTIDLAISNWYGQWVWANVAHSPPSVSCSTLLWFDLAWLKNLDCSRSFGSNRTNRWPFYSAPFCHWSSTCFCRQPQLVVSPKFLCISHTRPGSSPRRNCRIWWLPLLLWCPPDHFWRPTLASYSPEPKRMHTKFKQCHFKWATQFTCASFAIGNRMRYLSQICYSQHKAYRVQYVRFASAIEARDGCELAIEIIDFRTFAIRFEAIENHRLDIHFDNRPIDTIQLSCICDAN